MEAVNSVLAGARVRAFQAQCLYVKHLKIAARTWPSTTAGLLFPSAVMLVYFLIWNRLTPSSSAPIFDPIVDIGAYPPCRGPSGIIRDQCVSLLFSPNEGGALEIVNIFAATVGMHIGTDILGFPSASAVEEYISEQWNRTQAAVVFDSVGASINYTLWYNNSDGSAAPDIFTGQSYTALDVRESLKYGLDASILGWRADEASVPRPRIDMTSQTMPTGSSISLVQVDGMMLMLGPLFIFIALFPFQLMAVYAVVHEKRNCFRQGMRQMGLRDGAYWISWFAAQQTKMVFAVLLMMATGAACNLSLFRQVNFFVMFFMLTLYGAATVAFGLTVSTLISSPRVVNASTLLMFILGALFVMLWQGGSMMYGSYSDRFGSMILFTAPQFHLGRIMTDITARIALQQDEHSNVIAGPGFRWRDLYTNRGDDVPSGGDVLGYLVLLSMFFAFWTFYFDNVIPGKFGSTKEWYFLVTPKYWGLLGGRDSDVPLVTHKSHLMHSVLPDMDKDVTKEYQEVMSKSGPIPLRIVKMSKTFRKSYFRASENDARALDQLTIGAGDNMALALLGHNGAGKTTAINMLTGLHAASSGDAIIYGHSIQNDIDRVTSMIGVCPQHDILWPNLTAEEHLRLFCALRGIPADKIDNEMGRLFASVRLTSVRGHLTQTFSGGMKRRLSVAIACIGDPKILFLDEPTSGMDPLNRRHVWNLIQRLKKGRLIVLTTHSMEEADIIADKIGILAMGRLRAVGTPLHLKTRFGAGYHISLVTSNGRSHELKDVMDTYLPQAILETESSGSHYYNLASATLTEVTKFFEHLEEARRTRGDEALVTDWGVSSTTLQEVFLRITHGSDVEATGITDEAGQRAQLNVIVQGSYEPLGFVTIDGTTMLSSVRHEVQTQMQGAPAEWSFVSNGIRVFEGQEAALRAIDFLPLVTITRADGGEGTGGGREVEDDAAGAVSVRSQLDDLKQEVARLTSELKRRDELEGELRAQIEELQGEINALTSGH